MIVVAVGGLARSLLLFPLSRRLACRRQERCDELAAARNWAALRPIFRNTPYIDSLRPR